MSDLHGILFNMHIMYSVLVGIYAAWLGAMNKSISGNFWGALAIYTGIALITLIVGILLTISGMQLANERMVTYFLYMAYLVVIVPGLFSMLRGRDDRHAAIAFSVLALFNAGVSISMMQRGLAGPWL